jgi:hypothetical protein
MMSGLDSERSIIFRIGDGSIDWTRLEAPNPVPSRSKTQTAMKAYLAFWIGGRQMRLLFFIRSARELFVAPFELRDVQ